MPYQDLNHALKLFRGQVSESIPYAINELPPLDTPEQIFNYLKLRTKYKKDPKGRELFQTLPTLLENNWHGITGHGDCDCFTIAALAVLLANGFKDCGIVLVGRNPLVPVHIYAYVDYKGKREYLDLTNRVYNYERFYPFKQHIPYKINQNEKDMILELAEGLSARPRYVNVKSYSRSKTVAAHQRKFPTLSEQLSDFLSFKPKTKKKVQKYATKASTVLKKNPYGKVFVESVDKSLKYIPLRKKGIQVREDYFDGMSANAFQNMCLSEGVEVFELEELSSRRANRAAKKIAKQETKAAVKVAKQESKGTKQAAKQVNKAARVDSRMDRKVARQTNRQTNKAVKTQAKIQKKQNKVAVKASKPRNVRKSAPRPMPMPIAPAYEPQIDNSFMPPATDWHDVVQNAIQPQIQPEETFYPEEFETVETEDVTPDEQYEQDVEDMFMGEARILNITAPKLLLWGTGLTLLSGAAGFAMANRR